MSYDIKEVVDMCIKEFEAMSDDEFLEYILEVEYGENWRDCYIKELRERNKILLDRLHNSKRDNRENRDRQRSNIYKLVILNDDLINKSYNHELRNANVKLYGQLQGIKCLISDLAMYKVDINNCPGRFQRVIDELIKELDNG